MVEALINPKVLHWARKRSALAPEEVASSGITPEQVRTWEAGAGHPTFRQAGLLASALRIPLGYLFLDEPPDLPEPLTDLRTLPGARGEMSVDLRQVINDAKLKQDWYREFLIEEGAEPLPYVASFDLSHDPVAIAQDIRGVLGLEDLEGKTRAPDWRAYLKILTDRAEDAGVTVLRSGIVGNNTRRPLSVSEFRGFAIPDPVAPLIFINSRDYLVAQIFTLMHELAHVWLGREGVSDLDPTEPIFEGAAPEVESWCNSVAAEVLLPTREFLANWDRGHPLERTLSALATHFRVSEVAVLIKAHDSGLIEDDLFQNELARLRSRVPHARAGKGGDFRNIFPLRNGRNLSSAMLASALNGNLALRDAARMLGVRVVTLHKRAEEYGLR